MREKKRREILGKEKGLKPTSSGYIRIALGYPNTYSVGMSSLGFQWVWYLFNKRPDTICERFFYDTGNTTLESGRKIILFDFIAFSISYEMDYQRVIKMIEQTGLPVRADERDERMPVFIAGGGFASINPEPLAPFFDVIVVGDGEGVIDALLDRYHETKGVGKNEFLESIKDLRGIYIPSITFPVYRGGEIESFEGREVEQNVSFSHPVPFTPVVTPLSHFSDMELIEVERGCRFRCKFCTVGYVNAPFREYDMEEVLDVVNHHRIGLIGASLADYTKFDRIIERLKGRVTHIGVSSVRADRIKKHTMKSLVEMGLKTITIAPEVASKKLMGVISKGITEEQIMGFVNKANDSGIRRVKMYFLIGVPEEDLSDIEMMAGLIMKVNRAFNGEVRVSVNVMIPKPFTAFERLSLITKVDYNHRVSLLKKLIKGIRVDIMPYREAYTQTLFSRGDRRLFFDKNLDKDVFVYHMDSMNVLPWGFIKQNPSENQRGFSRG